MGKRFSIHLLERIAGGDAFATHHRPEAPDERGEVGVAVDDIGVVDVADDPERHQEQAGKQEDDTGVGAEKDEREHNCHDNRDDQTFQPPNDALLLRADLHKPVRPGVVGDGPVHDPDAEDRDREGDQVGDIQRRLDPVGRVDGHRYHEDDGDDRGGEEHRDVGVAPLPQEFDPLLECVPVDAPDTREFRPDEIVVGDARVDGVCIAVEHALKGLVPAPLGNRTEPLGITVAPPADQALHLCYVARRDVLEPFRGMLEDLGPGHGGRSDRGHVGVHEEQVLPHLLVLKDIGPEAGEKLRLLLKRHLALICVPDPVGHTLKQRFYTSISSRPCFLIFVVMWKRSQNWVYPAL